MSYKDYGPGIKLAVTWLHDRAREMNDPHAKAILNTAAFNLGVEYAQRMKPHAKIFPLANLIEAESPLPVKPERTLK